jgi:hypothetical protein
MAQLGTRALQDRATGPGHDVTLAATKHPDGGCARRPSARLGPKFNRRAYHDFLSQQGLLPPRLLEKAVRDGVHSAASAPPPTPCSARRAAGSMRIEHDEVGRPGGTASAKRRVASRPACSRGSPKLALGLSCDVNECRHSSSVLDKIQLARSKLGGRPVGRGPKSWSPKPPPRRRSSEIPNS